jgi:hypothetical protein
MSRSLLEDTLHRYKGSTLSISCSTTSVAQILLQRRIPGVMGTAFMYILDNVGTRTEL